MKILAIHNYHKNGSASGDDQVFRSETTLLENHGHEVIRYTVSNDEFDRLNIMGKLISIFGMLWSFKHYKNVKELIEAEMPDIVHIHTFFPLLSPSILYAAKRSGRKVVATLHDTRFICPCATSLRETEICNRCGDGNYFRMCKYKCFKASRIQSFLVACIFSYHRRRKSFYNQIDKYICLNDNQIHLLENIGFDRNKIEKKYNFAPDIYYDVETAPSENLPKRYVVFFGRIGEEKGIHILMRIWDKIKDIPLVVMGGGPLENKFKDWADRKSNVYFLGYTPHDKCLGIVKGAEFIVFPSICYEGCSMVEVETESLGKGIIATDLGFSAEAIRNDVNGYVIPINDIECFAQKIEELWKHPEKSITIGKNARKDYELKYRPEENYLQLMKIYDELIKR